MAKPHIQHAFLTLAIGFQKGNCPIILMTMSETPVFEWLGQLTYSMGVSFVKVIVLCSMEFYLQNLSFELLSNANKAVMHKK